MGVHISPDRDLDLESAERVTVQDVRAAWERAYAELGRVLRQQGPPATLYLVFGLQGSGKSTWIDRHLPHADPGAVFLDGPLPTRQRRSRALGIARDAGCGEIVGVWIDTPLDLALARNAARRGLARIREEVIREGHAQFEAPSLQEGFSRIVHVAAQTSTSASGPAW